MFGISLDTILRNVDQADSPKREESTFGIASGTRYSCHANACQLFVSATF